MLVMAQDNTHAEELEQFIEERRQKALLQIEKMRGEPPVSKGEQRGQRERYDRNLSQ